MQKLNVKIAIVNLQNIASTDSRHTHSSTHDLMHLLRWVNALKSNLMNANGK